MLALSLQFRAVVAFLAQDATTKDYRVDAPHLAIALAHEQVSTPHTFCLVTGVATVLPDNTLFAGAAEAPRIPERRREGTSGRHGATQADSMPHAVCPIANRKGGLSSRALL